MDEAEVPYVALVAPEVILNHGFVQELRSAITDPGLEGLRWIALASDGLDRTGEAFDTGNYLEDPATPGAGPLRIAGWSEPAVAVFCTGALKELTKVSGGFDDLADIVEAGARNDLPLFLTRRLRYSSMSDRWTANPGLDAARLRASATAVTLGAIRPDPTVTVVIRTTFERPRLLHRNLTALAAEHRSSPILEAILVSTSDVARFSELATQPGAAIEHLPLTSLQADDASIPSRTAAMVTALQAARGDYVWYVDDDDWAAPGSIQFIKDAVHAVDRPILIGASEAFEEEWDGETLTNSILTRRYVPDEWYRAFTGWNFLPNCSIVIPRDLALQRLGDVPITRNLGEDYALQLLLLTAPGSMVQVIEQNIAHISRRAGDDNTVTMEDRGPWLRDLGSHISDLSKDSSATTASFWRLGSEVRKIPYPEAGGAVEDPAQEPGFQPSSKSTAEGVLRGRLRTATERIRAHLPHDPA